MSAANELVEMLSIAATEEGVTIFDHTAEEIGLHVMDNHREVLAALSSRRMNLVKSTCEVRDERWSIHIDAGDEPCGVRVKHRQYGDYYDWPEATFEGPGGVYGGICAAADRAYAMQEESSFRTRSAAMKAAHDFLRRFGAGEVEYLEWDVDSQSMVVVGHEPRRSMWWKHPDDKPDPLAPFHSGSDVVDADEVKPELDDEWFEKAEIRDGDRLIRPARD